MDTTRECTEWKEAVRREWTSEEKVLEKSAPQREKRRGVEAVEEEEGLMRPLVGTTEDSSSGEGVNAVP